MPLISARRHHNAIGRRRLAARTAQRLARRHKAVERELIDDVADDCGELSPARSRLRDSALFRRSASNTTRRLWALAAPPRLVPAVATMGRFFCTPRNSIDRV